MTETRTTATLSIAGITEPLRVRAVRGEERISDAFRYEVDFQSTALPLAALRGAGAFLELTDRFGARRFVTGVVQSVSSELLDSAHAQEELGYRIAVVPHVQAVLGHRHGYRIFQDQSVQEIVTQVVQNAGLAGELIRWELTDTYPSRAYCVQYDETEWSFICRILEDEGVWFCFEHAPDGSTMVFWDHNEHVPEANPAELGFALHPHVGGDTPRVWAWNDVRKVQVSKLALNDYDLEHPSRSLLSEAETSEVLEVPWYAYPGGFVDPAQGDRLAQTRLDALGARRTTASAQTNALALQPGQRFDLLGHPQSDGWWFVTGSTLHIRLEERSDTGALSDAGPETTDIHLEALPTTHRFRPAQRAHRPRPVGLQTATVTGPAGEEIHTDSLGRVKVQFRWDRHGELDENTSCWLRVSQQHTTGSVAIPRIGWEVLVDFIDGDPDRPVCLGKLWNVAFPPPADLPAQRAQTHFASQSSPGSEGANQVLFDDTADAETITVNACHDQMVRAANDKTSQVGRDRTHHVTGGRTASVGGTEVISISSNHSSNVTGDQTLDVGSSRTVRVNGSATVQAEADQELTVAGAATIKVGSIAVAILETLAGEAISRGTDAVAGRMTQAAEKVLGPMEPILARARERVGPALQYAGPAAALFGGDDRNTALLGQAAGALSSSEAAAEAGSMAAGLLNSAVADEVAAAGRAAAMEHFGGGGGGGDESDGPGEATSAGSGTWSTTVKGNVEESVGGLANIGSASGISFTVGGNLKEVVGAARIAMTAAGNSETTGGGKVETVGTYLVKASESVSISAQAGIAFNVAGSQRQTIGAGYSVSSKGPVVLSAPKLKLKAKSKITLACGSCKVIVSAGKVEVDGASELIIQGSKIKGRESALGS